LLGAGNLKNRDVIVIEDIVDTGLTLEHIVSQLKKEGVASFKIASLFFKPEAYKKSLPIDYIGLEIPNKFIVGYGLDYNGLGRNLPEIYQLKSSIDD
jgi:hypoxanthine phosphoribosyltransferase